MKAKTARTLLMAGTIIGGVMYFSQAAKAQDTRLKAMTTENRMNYNTKEQLAQQVTGASNEFAAQSMLEADLNRVDNQLRVNRVMKESTEQAIQQNLANGTWATAEDAVKTLGPGASMLDRANAFKNMVEPLEAAQADLQRLTPLVATLEAELERLVNQNQRSGDYRRNNLIL